MGECPICGSKFMCFCSDLDKYVLMEKEREIEAKKRREFKEMFEGVKLDKKDYENFEGSAIELIEKCKRDLIKKIYESNKKKLKEMRGNKNDK